MRRVGRADHNRTDQAGALDACWSPTARASQDRQAPRHSRTRAGQAHRRRDTCAGAKAQWCWSGALEAAAQYPGPVGAAAARSDGWAIGQPGARIPSGQSSEKEAAKPALSRLRPSGSRVVAAFACIVTLAVAGCGAQSASVTASKPLNQSKKAGAAGVTHTVAAATKLASGSPVRKEAHRGELGSGKGRRAPRAGASTPPRTVGGKRSGQQGTADATGLPPAPSPGKRYISAVMAIERQCGRLPPIASIASKPGKVEARTVALMLLPRAYPLRQLFTELASTYRGAALLRSHILRMHRLAVAIVDALEVSLGDTRPIRSTRLGHLIVALTRDSSRFSLRECSV